MSRRGVNSRRERFQGRHTSSGGGYVHELPEIGVTPRRFEVPAPVQRTVDSRTTQFITSQFAGHVHLWGSRGTQRAYLEACDPIQLAKQADFNSHSMKDINPSGYNHFKKAGKMARGRITRGQIEQDAPYSRGRRGGDAVCAFAVDFGKVTPLLPLRLVVPIDMASPEEIFGQSFDVRRVSPMVIRGSVTSKGAEKPASALVEDLQFNAKYNVDAMINLIIAADSTVHHGGHDSSYRW